MRDNIKFWKRITGIGLSMVLVMGLCACGGEDKWIFSLNGEKIYDRDVAVFGYIFTEEYHVKNREQLLEDYDEERNYEQYYKNLLEEEIIETVLLYKEAKEQKMKLTKNDKSVIETNVKAFMKYVEEDELEKYKISKQDVEKICEMRLMADLYKEKYGSFNEKEDKAEGGERYIKVFQVIFPIAMLDENGMVQSDDEGDLKQVSPAQVNKMREAAETFSQRVRDGEDLESLLEEQDESVRGVEKYLKYEDLQKDYKAAIDSLLEGQVSNVISSDYGFYVVRLEEKNASEYAETLTRHEEQVQSDEKRKNEWSDIYSAYVGTNQEYKNTEKWNQISISDYVH